MAALNGVLGAPPGSGPTDSPSGERSRPMFSTAPSGPRSPSRTWLAAATTTGLRAVWPRSRDRARGQQRPRGRLADEVRGRARVSTSPSLGSRSGTQSSSGSSISSPSGSPSSISTSSSAPAAPSMVAWWTLVRMREAVVGQALDHVALPERAAAIERAADDARHQLGDLLVVARGRHRGVAHVEVEVEARVVDPVRVVEVEGHVEQPAAQRLEEVEPALDLVAPRRQRLVVGIVGPLVDRQARHVAELRPRLHVEERGVQPRQLLHADPLLSGRLVAGDLGAADDHVVHLVGPVGEPQRALAACTCRPAASTATRRWRRGSGWPRR